MDKHKALFKALERVGAGPKHLEYIKSDEIWTNGHDHKKYPEDALVIDEHAHALIEQAAMVWLMGRSKLSLTVSRDDDIVIYAVSFRAVLHVGSTLVEALLQAVQREGGEVEDGN